jgi:hypothetical protein
MRLLWCFVIAWAALSLGGVVYYAWLWAIEPQNPARNEAVIGAGMAGILCCPAVAAGLALTIWKRSRAVARYRRAAWAVLGAVLAVWAGLVVAASMT